MADIELVIKIPEEVKQTFDNAKNEDLYGNYYDRNSLIGKAIQNGIPLPKGHGRLIDADELFLDIQTDEQMRLGEHLAWVRERIEDAPTVIKADIPTMYYPQVEGITPTIIEADKESEVEE